jgi:hypothetical protein
VARSAPRYSEVLLDAIGKLDSGDVSIAETCRRICDHADELGLTRPSYVHLRRLVHASRDRKAAIAELRSEILADAASGRVTNPLWLADSVRELPKGVRGGRSA